MIAPATTRVTLGYGAIDAPYSPNSPHAGVDFSHEGDANVYAPEDGMVTFTGWMGTAGEAIEIVSGDHRHRLCHLSVINVSPNQYVKKGQVIGVMGETGKWPDGSKSAFGVHLHWVMWVGATRVNGLQYINEESAVNITREQIRWHYRTIAGAEPSEREIQSYEGKDYAWATEEIKRWFANNNADAWAYRAKVAALENEVKTLRATQGDATKWETLRVLLREFLGIK